MSDRGARAHPLLVIRPGGHTYTSTGVRAPCVTEQQTAPARAKREYRAKPVFGAAAVGAAMAVFSATAAIVKV